MRITPCQNKFLKIWTDRTVTEVLGTEFILEKESSVTDLQVTEGKVSFSLGKEKMILNPNILKCFLQ